MLKNKNVWIILSGEFIAGLGLWAGIIGNLEFMQRHVPSDFFKSLILFAGLLAGVFAGPMAGRIIDSKSKKTVLLYAGLGRMLSVLFMFAALHYESVVLMVLFMVCIQLSAAFYFPALQAAIPLIVKENELIQLNGIHMNTATIARVIGTALSGAVLAVTSLEVLYGASMAAYGLLFLLTFFLQINENERAETGLFKKKGSFNEILPILKNAPVAFTALVLTIIPTLFLGGFNLMVINISELQHSTAIKGWLYTTEGLSFMAGAFLIKKLSSKYNSIKLMFFFAFVISIAHLSLYFSNLPAASLLSFALFGFGVGSFFPIASTIFQTKISKEYHGRFFSFRNMLDRVMFQIVLLGTGLFLDTIGLPFMVLIFGALSLAIVLSYGYRILGKTGIRNMAEEAPAGK